MMLGRRTELRNGIPGREGAERVKSGDDEYVPDFPGHPGQSKCLAVMALTYSFGATPSLRLKAREN